MPMQQRGECGHDIYPFFMAGTRGDREARIDYVCGAAASLLNVWITFPINKLMFRQQMEGIRVHKALRQLLKEGARNAYRGVLPPLLQRTVTVSLMFGTYTKASHYITNHGPQSLPFIITHSLAATTAGFAEAVLVPLERTQCLLQHSNFNKELRNTRHTFEVLYRNGFKEYYRGLSAVLLRNSVSNMLFLGLREPLKQSLPTPETQLRELGNSFISGAGLGAFLSTLFFPLNVVKNHMMTQIGGEYKGIRRTFKIVFEERNRRWKKMFRGVHVNYTRSFISWGIINMAYDFLHKLFINNDCL